MAIKGKRKPKARSGRAVTAGPRPRPYVPPKVPLFQRTGAKFLVALVFEATIFSLLVGFGEQSEADRQRAVIGEFTTLVDAALGGAPEAIQPIPGGAQVLPQLGTRLAEALQGQVADPEAVVEEAVAWSDAVTDAASGVLSVQVEFEILDLEQRNALASARDLIERGLHMHAGLADQLAVAVMIEGDPQTDLLASMQEQLTVATLTFQSGYEDLQEVRRLVGLPTNTTAAGPGGGFPPPGLPEGTQVVPAEPPSGGGGGGGNG